MGNELLLAEIIKSDLKLKLPREPDPREAKSLPRPVEMSQLGSFLSEKAGIFFLNQLPQSTFGE